MNIDYRLDKGGGNSGVNRVAAGHQHIGPCFDGNGLGRYDCTEHGSLLMVGVADEWRLTSRLV
jgi:hypothetical protein